MKKRKYMGGEIQVHTIRSNEETKALECITIGSPSSRYHCNWVEGAKLVDSD